MRQPKSFDEELDQLLGDICRQAGFCLSADKSRVILARRRWEAREFALEVLRLEGFPVPEYEKTHLRYLTERFKKHFDRATIRAEEFERD